MAAPVDFRLAGPAKLSAFVRVHPWPVRFVQGNARTRNGDDIDINIDINIDIEIEIEISIEIENPRRRPIEEEGDDGHPQG